MGTIRAAVGRLRVPILIGPDRCSTLARIWRETSCLSNGRLCKGQISYHPEVRSVFVFPACSRKEASAVIRAHGIRPDLSPMTSEIGDPQTVWAEFWAPSELEAPEWEPDDLARVAGYLGEPVKWAVEVTLTGRVNGRRELHALISDLLAAGGCSTDFDGELHTASQIHHSGPSGAWLG
jgi:hypothetical protein